MKIIKYNGASWNRAKQVAFGEGDQKSQLRMVQKPSDLSSS